MIDDYLINKTVVYNSVEGIIFQLSKPDAIIKLSKPGAKCLQILIDARHQIVSQDTLVKDIWGQKGIIVGPNTLYQHIYMLRKSFSALGVDKEIIKTTPQVGFNISENYTILRIENQFKCIENQIISDKKKPTTLLKNKNPPTLIDSLFGNNRLFYFMGFIVILSISLVNSHNDRQPLNDESLINQDTNCILYSHPDNLSLAQVNSPTHDKENVFPHPIKYRVINLVGYMMHPVDKQGYLVYLTDTPLFYCNRL